MVDNPSPPSEQAIFEIAVEHACVRVPIVAPDRHAAEVRQSLLGQQYDSVTHIIVCQDDRFVGILRIEDLLGAPAETIIGESMDREPPVVAPGVDQEIAAWRAVQHGESALAVVDEAGRFRGLIPPDRLLTVLLQEHEEDLSRLGGFLKNSSMAQKSSKEAVCRRFWHRLPWLLLGLLGAIVAADLVGWFETQLQEKVVLAFFIPGVVYLADAVGTQTETVVVRGLSVGVGIRQMIWREIWTGLLIGCVLALIAYPILLWRWGEWQVALGVSLALLAACSTASLVAMVLPWLLDRCNLDPAFGSGPIATVIQDLLSILIYFYIVTVIIR